MPKLIKNSSIIDNDWTTLDKGFDGNLNSEPGPTLVPLQYFLTNADALKGNEELGVWLDSDEGPEPLRPYLSQLKVVAINFPKFADGRGYSYAHILRGRLNFSGEIRAIGDVLHDQLFYLKRCGFDAFAIRDDTDAEVALSGFKDFSDCYQTSIEQPTPLFRRKA